MLYRSSGQQQSLESICDNTLPKAIKSFFFVCQNAVKICDCNVQPINLSIKFLTTKPDYRKNLSLTSCFFALWKGLELASLYAFLSRITFLFFIGWILYLTHPGIMVSQYKPMKSLFDYLPIFSRLVQKNDNLFVILFASFPIDANATEWLPNSLQIVSLHVRFIIDKAKRPQ